MPIFSKTTLNLKPKGIQLRTLRMLVINCESISQTLRNFPASWNLFTYEVQCLLTIELDFTSHPNVTVI